VWEFNQVEILSQVLDNKRLLRNGEGMTDKWFWRDVESTIFFVKATYNSLLGEESVVYGDLFAEFWKLKTLPSTKITAWRVLSNTIATKDSLLRHDNSLVCDRCPLCGVEEDTVSHLFF